LDRRRQRISPAVASGAEHEQLWRRMSAVAPVEHYQRSARRRLPVVLLASVGVAAPVRAPRRPAELRPAFGV
jgi:hypothetical protein